MVLSPETSACDYAAPLAVREGAESAHVLDSFEFDSGETLRDLKIGYATHGKPNRAKDNAILLMPGTANTRHAADGYIGPGNALDTDRYFIIASDAIGAGTSSRPHDGLGGKFPRYNVRDMVRAQYRLIFEGFGISRLKAVMGASMGAFQSLEWSIHFPSSAERAILLVPSFRAGNIFRTIVGSMIRVIESDPNWNDGMYCRPPVDGLRLAGRLYFPWTVADEHLQRLDPAELERELGLTVERSASWDAWDLIRRYQASCSHDIAQPFGGDEKAALARVQIPLLVMPTTTDRLLGIDGAKAIARLAPRSQYHEIPSERGHLGWRPVIGSPEMKTIVTHIRRFLEDPR